MIMPNSVKKNIIQQETENAPEANSEADDFDFASLDDLANFMVDALTIPMPADFRDTDSCDIGEKDMLAPSPSKRLN
ncbi:hypothetical protein [Rhizobium sp. ZW T2_16]|jgi:hypothetical protein|uniref:hypothetical protein n=1 Tax=Rhizobium sp. ZW T2_16 TaxID=3378083 RepID=UPI0038542AC4